MGRSKAKQRGTFSDKREGLTISGVDEFAKKLDDMFYEVMPVAIPKLFEAVGKAPYRRLYEFMSPGLHYRKHTNGKPNTRDFLGKWLKKNKELTLWNYKIGFELKKGQMAGLPALFLDLGTRPHQVSVNVGDKKVSYVTKKGKTVTYVRKARSMKLPYIKPTYFVHYAFKDTEKEMVDASQEMMAEILKEVNKG